MKIFNLRIREKLIWRFCALATIVIVALVSCVGCGTEDVNSCPGNVNSSTSCQIVVDGGSAPGAAPSGGSLSTAAPTGGSSAAASADGSAPATTSPSGGPVTASPESTIGSPGPPPVEKNLPLMVPITSQPGWTLVWSGQKSIGPQGIIVSKVNPTYGPETGTGDEFDLQYVASAGGWGSGLNYLFYWTNNYRPGPATITGLLQNENFSGENPSGMPAHIGDRLFAAMDTEAEGFDIVFYMQVAEVGQESVLVNMWIWNSV